RAPVTARSAAPGGRSHGASRASSAELVRTAARRATPVRSRRASRRRSLRSSAHDRTAAHPTPTIPGSSPRATAHPVTTCGSLAASGGAPYTGSMGTDDGPTSTAGASTRGYHRGAESAAARLDRNWNELLQEIRVLQTGSQILAAFLVVLPFQARFEDLDALQVGWYL